MFSSRNQKAERSFYSEGKQGWDDLSILGKLLNPEMLCLSVKWEFFFKGGGVYGGNSSVLLTGLLVREPLGVLPAVWYVLEKDLFSFLLGNFRVCKVMGVFPNL